MTTTINTDVKVLTAYARKSLHDLSDQFRHDIARMSEPRGQALFETAAEVLEGLIKAFADYDEGSEIAWQR